MKIGLVNPRGLVVGDEALLSIFEDLSRKYVFRPKFSGFGLGLLIVAALTPPDIKVEVVDENFEDIPFEKDYDLVGITANTAQATRAYEIADEFRRRGSSVALGGIHATLLPDEARQHADTVLVGECERLWPQLLEDFCRKRLKYEYREAEEVDLCESPIPRYDLLKKENYNIIWVQTTRGCPHDCEFCAASRVYGKRYRRKSIGQIIKEVELIQSIWGRPQISFADDNMLVDRRHSRQLLNELRKLNIKFMVQSDISVAKDVEFLELLRDSGCSILFIGLETLSAEGLKRINSNKWKARHLDRYEEYIDRIQSIGIGVMGAFIVGLDTDTVAVFDEIADFVLRTNLYAMQVTVATPYPGSRLRERLLTEGRVINLTDWSKYTCNDVNIIPLKMTGDQLKAGFLAVNRKIYSDDVCIGRMKHFKELYKRSVDWNELRAE